MAKNTKSQETTTEAKAPESQVKVTVLCKKHNLDPKRVRARLRRMYANPEQAAKLPKQLVEGSWTFAEKDRKAVETLIAAMVKASTDES